MITVERSDEGEDPVSQSCASSSPSFRPLSFSGDF